MPRNSGTGVYSPPPNITAISGATIESADWNALVSDLTSVLNSAVPVNLGGTGVSSLSSFLTTLGGMPVAGGTFTGPVTMAGDATASLQPVTKQQFDTGLATKANTSHNHVAANITDFATAVTTAIGASSIDALSDVAITAPSNYQILRYNAGQFANVDSYVEYDKGTFTNSTSFTQAHGLGRYPSAIAVYLECTTTDGGWAVGDRLLISTGAVTNVGTSGLSVGVSTTTMTVSKYTDFIEGITKAGTSRFNLASANWKMIFRVYP